MYRRLELGDNKMDFNKGDFRKEEDPVLCVHCESKQPQFTLLRQNLQWREIEFQNPAYARSRHDGHRFRLMNDNSLPVHNFLNVLRRNIFADIDEICKQIITTKEEWSERVRNLMTKRRGNRTGQTQEISKAFLDVFHYVGDEENYNQLLMAPPHSWGNKVRKFYSEAYRNSHNGAQYLDRYMKDLAMSLKNGTDGNHPSVHGRIWYTNTSEDDAKALINQWINSNISGGIRRDQFLLNEMKKMAEEIYVELGKPEPTKKYAWETNSAKNSPLTNPDPKDLGQQFNHGDVFEGAEYCNHCGAEKSRSLMIETTFRPFSGDNDEEVAIQYLGRIQDIHTDVLPQIERIWKEQLREIKRRVNRATKRWDAAQARLEKRLEKEEERKRQAEIAKLEEKLNSLKNNDK